MNPIPLIRRLAKIAALPLLFFSACTYASTVSLVIDSSTQKLTGATSIMVDGNPYDVTFVDGTCAQIFAICGGSHRSPFLTNQLAEHAAQALIDQVFIDSSLGDFSSDPTTTYGCEKTAFGVCYVMTIIENDQISLGANARFVTANWASGVSLDNIGFQGYPTYTLDTTLVKDRVWALWAPAATAAVPEPSTLAMLGLGCGILGWTRRQQRTLRPKASNNLHKQA